MLIVTQFEVLEQHYLDLWPECFEKKDIFAVQ